MRRATVLRCLAATVGSGVHNNGPTPREEVEAAGRAAPASPGPSATGSNAESKQSQRSKPNPNVEGEAEEQQKLRVAYVRAVLEKDKELLDLKRLHELSVLRVGEQQARHLSEYESKAVYFEECISRVSLDTVTVQEHTRKNVLWHAIGRAKVRGLKVFLHFCVTIIICSYLTWRYRMNPKRYYSATPIRVIGSEGYRPETHPTEIMAAAASATVEKPI